MRNNEKAEKIELIKMRKMKKKAQEEMVGFVMIVIIVVIVSVILLGISLRNSDAGVQKESKEIYQFLESLMGYTTDCALRYEPAYSTIGELISECSSNSAILCINGEMACDKVKQEVDSILSASWKIGEDAPIKGFDFESVYSEGDESEKEVALNITQGNCGESFSAGEYLLSAFPGTITNMLKLCY